MKTASVILRKFLNAAENVPLVFAMFLFAVMLVIGFASVVLRYIVHVPLSWTEEVLAFMMAWGIFLGGASVTRSYSHIRMTFFAERILGKRLAPVVWTALENIVGMGATTFAAYEGYRWMMHSYRIGAKGIGDIPYPYWVVRMVVLIGFGLMSLFYIERTVRMVRTKGKAGTEQQTALLDGGSGDAMVIEKQRE